MEHFNADENKIGFKTHCTETATGKRLIYHALFVQKSVFQQKLFFKLLFVHTTVGSEFYTKIRSYPAATCFIPVHTLYIPVRRTACAISTGAYL
eukprot:SAG11_NODE_24876_length_366_cov_2.996255_1_plen_94_part_00